MYRYNMCCGGYKRTYSIVRQVERELLLPGLKNPPKDFRRMAEAYMDGLNQKAGFSAMSCESVLALFYQMLGEPVVALSWADTARFYGLKLMMWGIARYPRLANNVVKAYFE